MFQTSEQILPSQSLYPLPMNFGLSLQMDQSGKKTLLTVDLLKLLPMPEQLTSQSVWTVPYGSQELTLLEKENQMLPNTSTTQPAL